MSRRHDLLALGVAVVVVLASGVAAAVLRDAGPEVPPGDGVDVGFLQDMIDHHEQAALLSLIALRNDASQPVRESAVDVIASQREEIGTMEGWLTLWGHERGQPTREVMGWMGMGTSLEDMPGMASREEIDRLASLQGRALDLLFLELMIEHHEGGIHMGEHAEHAASNVHVRSLARRIALNQQREIRHLRGLHEAVAASEPAAG